MECEICRAPMTCEPNTNLTYHRCPGCGGFWFNGGELESMISQRIALPLKGLEPQTPEKADDTPEECPHCRHGVRLVPMTTYATSKVRVLGCPVCFGHWLTHKQAGVLVRQVCWRGPVGLVKRLFN